MSSITLKAEAGRRVGSSDARRLRREGRIPAVVYGKAVEAMPIAVDARELRAALSTDAGVNTLVSLEVDGTKYLTMAREIQRHPVRHTVVHVDFQVVERDQLMAADVTVTLVGEAVEVAHADGVVDQSLFTLAVKAKPDDIPHVIEVDISALTVGGSIRIADVELPPGVTTDLDPETPIVTGVPPRVAARAGEGAEGAERGGGEEARATGDGSESSGT